MLIQMNIMNGKPIHTQNLLPKKLMNLLAKLEELTQPQPKV